jgi:16S rRNA (guanine966-N2)-methyltransferase
LSAARTKSLPNKTTGEVRIIGGLWRGRKIQFANAEGLRPTSDRIRETLFNWLTPVMEGACCLDLFAGSGVLGFEAASRGASQVTMIESATAAAAQLKKTRTLLQAEQVEILPADALRALRELNKPFEIIFLDPPFASGLWLPVLSAIDRQQLLAPHGLIYIEYPSRQPLQLPAGWQWRRHKKAGEVCYGLAVQKPMSVAAC